MGGFMWCWNRSGTGRGRVISSSHTRRLNGSPGLLGALDERLQVQLRHHFLDNIRADCLASPRVSQHQGAEADIVDISRDALTALRNQCQSVRCEEKAARIARHPEPVLDIAGRLRGAQGFQLGQDRDALAQLRDRKSTRLNSSHVAISYAVFCLKKKI